MKKVDDMNYYELLNIEPTANNEEIRKAYQVASQTYSPGSLALYSVLSEAERARMLDRVEKAYKILMDRQERERYDHEIGLPSEWKTSGQAKGKPQDSLVDSFIQENQGSPKISSSKQEEPMPELSDPQYLKKLRERKGISLKEISEVTNISVKSLTALENSEYSQLPGRAYIVGFLRSYSEYIGINVQQAKAHFEVIFSQQQPQRKK